MKTKDIEGLKGFLVEQCLNDGTAKHAIIVSGIDFNNVQCRFEGGEWATVSSDKFQDLMRWKESLGWELDMQLSCTLAGDNVSQTVMISDVNGVGFKDGDFVAIGRDAVLANIDFSRELDQAIAKLGIEEAHYERV